MTDRIELSVFRRLDDRIQGEHNDSPFAFELHERRRRALEDAIGDDDDIQVLDWGQTKDTKPHELVTIALVYAASKTAEYVVVPGLKLLGEKLLDMGVEKAATELITRVVSRLRPKQQAEQIADFQLRLPRVVTVNVMPPDRGSQIHVSAPDLASFTIDYTGESE